MNIIKLQRFHQPFLSIIWIKLKSGLVKSLCLGLNCACRYTGHLSFRASVLDVIQDKRPLCHSGECPHCHSGAAEGEMLTLSFKANAPCHSGQTSPVISLADAQATSSMTSEAEGRVEKSIFFSKNPLNFQPRIGLAATSNDDFPHYPRTIILRG